MEQVTKTRVRYADSDQMGYVHHAKYFEYFEIGRTEYMREKGPTYAEMEESGFYLVLSEAHASYRRPARYDMELTIRTRLREMTHAQVIFEYAVEEGGDIICEGWTKLACTDRNGKLRRIPENTRKALKGDS